MVLQYFTDSGCHYAQHLYRAAQKTTTERIIRNEGSKSSDPVKRFINSAYRYREFNFLMLIRFDVVLLQ